MLDRLHFLIASVSFFSYNIKYFVLPFFFLQAIRSFQVAFHLYPSNKELWEEDLKWAQQLLQQKREVEGKNLQSNGRDACTDSIPDYDFESDEVVAVCDAISQKQKRANKNKTVVVSSSGTIPCQQSEEDQTSSDDPTSYIKAR